MMRRHGREASVAIAIGVLSVVLAAVAPAYFSAENLNDLFLANTAVFVVALGATLVILAGEIDISVGSVFAVAGVVAGVVATLGAPVVHTADVHGNGLLGAGIIPDPAGAAPNTFMAQFNSPGVFTYRCLIHDGMTGTVTVKA